jgi:hypothetical protein
LPKNLSRILAKGAAAFLVALLVWWGLSVPYTRLLASLSESVIRLGERPPITSIVPEGTLMIIDRTDLPQAASTVRLAVESTDITFNFVLLMTLFAASSRALSDRNVFGFAAAAGALLVVHVFAVVAFVKADYAQNFGSWSALHYGSVAREFWVRSPYFYSVVGVYGFAFALWWLFRPWPDSSSKRPLGVRRATRTSARGRA